MTPHLIDETHITKGGLMRIGDITITGLIDGEAVVKCTAFYPGLTQADWEPHAYLLEPVLGQYQHLNTLGGYLIRSDDRIVVVDLGAGPRPRLPFAGGAFRSAFAATGLRRSDVTDVVFTHLHFDHIGWASVDGRPFFPNATYRVDARDWQWFLGDDFPVTPEQIAASHVRLGTSARHFDPETDAPAARLRPVVDQVELFDAQDGVELAPGVVALDASGHTPGTVVIEVRDGSDVGLLLGDLVHAEPELLEDNSDGRWDLLSATDHQKSVVAIEHFRRRIHDERLPVAGGHFPGLRWGRVVNHREKKVWEHIHE